MLVFALKSDEASTSKKSNRQAKKPTAVSNDEEPRKTVRRKDADENDPTPRDRHAQQPDATDDDPRPANTAPSVRNTIASASDVFKDALASWNGGSSCSGYLASASHIEKIDIPEWGEYGFEIEKKSFRPDTFATKTEKRFWLTAEFKNQGANPIRRLLAVKLGANGRWTITPVKDGEASATPKDDDPPTDDAKPDDAKPDDPKPDSAKPDDAKPDQAAPKADPDKPAVSDE